MTLHPRIAILALCSIAGAQTDPRSDLVKQKAEELGKATVAGNFAVVMDMTYSKVVEMMGGRDKALELIETQMKAMKDQGIAISAFQVGVPSEFKTSGSDLFTVIPTSMELKLPDGKLTGTSYLVGISSDQGKTWFFVDGSQLTAENIKSMFPKFPALKLPAKTPPVVTKNP